MQNQDKPPVPPKPEASLSFHQMPRPSEDPFCEPWSVVAETSMAGSVQMDVSHLKISYEPRGLLNEHIRRAQHFCASAAYGWVEDRLRQITDMLVKTHISQMPDYGEAVEQIGWLRQEMRSIGIQTTDRDAENHRIFYRALQGRF